MPLRARSSPYQLDRMSHRELLRACLAHHAVRSYALLALVCGVAAWHLAGSAAELMLAPALVVVLYPFVEYLLHRFVLHSRLLYRHRATAALWKRIHFDHHRDPHDLRVLFGALHTTLPTVLVILAPVGYLAGGRAGSAAAVATGLVLLCLYEYCHCLQHLPYTPHSRFLRLIKARHLRHHFLDERRNFGITSPIADRLFGTDRDALLEQGRSPTVFNLGYAGEERRRFPWVARLTPGLERTPEVSELRARSRAA